MHIYGICTVKIAYKCTDGLFAWEMIAVFSDRVILIHTFMERFHISASTAGALNLVYTLFPIPRSMYLCLSEENESENL